MRLNTSLVAASDAQCACFRSIHCTALHAIDIREALFASQVG